MRAIQPLWRRHGLAEYKDAYKDEAESRLPVPWPSAASSTPRIVGGAMSGLMSGRDGGALGLPDVGNFPVCLRLSKSLTRDGGCW